MHCKSDNVYDLVIIGGGVNGCGIANDAAGRGLKVLLCEKDDLASSTSSKSSKLIHGGLRYLEHYEFRLVREALAERETLIKNAPHIIWPLRFILPHQPHLRPRWMILAGLFLYDHLAKRTTLAASRGISFNEQSPLVETLKKGFEYSDAWVDDSRLVVLNAVSAKDSGAEIKTHCSVVKATRGKQNWQVKLQDTMDGSYQTVECKMLVNAAGPWVGDLFKSTIEAPTSHNVRLIKGSHIVVPKLHDQPEAYILQNEDNRIVFVVPYEDEFSLVGTTDVEVDIDPSKVSISDEEVDYLIDISNRYFKQKIGRKDIVHSYSGVRPLLDDESSSPQAITRDYTLEVEGGTDSPPLLSIFGGKITTYRKLANAALEKIAPFFPDIKSSWTHNNPLPGGDFQDQPGLIDNLLKEYPWLEKSVAKRYARSYGTLSYKILASCRSRTDMGTHIGHGLYECEVAYLVEHEWARTVEDVIWRRSKLGLRLNSAQKEQVATIIAHLHAKETPTNEAQQQVSSV